MKKEQRAKYLMLTELPYPKKTKGFVHMCGMCRYAEWSGNSCEDAELECHFPVEEISENCFETWMGGDCWGFSPRYHYEDCVDMAGLFLQGEYPDMQNCEDKTPNWYFVNVE